MRTGKESKKENLDRKKRESMTRYEMTIAKNRPEYLNKKLLLTNRKRDGLFIWPNGSYIQIEVNRQGKLSVNEITPNFQHKPLPISLRRIGTEILQLKDPSVNQMLKYFVLPEMEVERIFNTLRYKYLQAIYDSKLTPPSEFISYLYNNAFQALAGITVYQGNTKKRKPNYSFWKDAGFKKSVQESFKGDKEKEELSFILSFIKHANDHYFSTYKELIGIKPGVHEVWIHADYFEDIPKKNKPKKNKPRDQIFKMLRGKGGSPKLSLKKMPPEINKNNYFSYASCNVTEGPFVFRKNIDVSYFDEIRKIRSKNDLGKLQKNFHVLDYCLDKIENKKQLKEFLDRANRFKGFF